jgi:hypothetical protein
MLFEAMDTREGVIEWVKTASHHPSASLAELGDPPDGRAGAAEVSGSPPGRVGASTGGKQRLELASSAGRVAYAAAGRPRLA